MQCFKRVDTDANSQTPDDCCGEFVGRTSGEDVPDVELSGDVVYVYARCRNCNALWRDGFRDADITKYNSGQLDVYHKFLDYEFSHIDTNEVHDGRASVVYMPTNNPVDYWEDDGDITSERADKLREKWNAEEYQRREAYVYRFSELESKTTN